jgi:hypothetical protein
VTSSDVLVDGSHMTDGCLVGASSADAADSAALPGGTTPPPKNLSPALARALARKQKAQSGTGGVPSPSPSPVPTDSADTARGQSQMPDVLDHAAEEDEPLAADIEAQVREAAERAALQKAAEEAGERLDEEPSGLDGGEDDDDDDDDDDASIVVLARFKVNKHDAVSVFKATTKEDFKDVVKLLPENTPLPASNKMTYLIARLELNPSASIVERIQSVNSGRAMMADAVGPAVGCLMATFGTNMISSCIFDFDDPEELEEFAVEERIELWGLQVRPPCTPRLRCVRA